MDAVEYVKTRHRLCATFLRCTNCPLKGNCGSPTDPEGNVKAVEEWAKEHPAKTRQSELLKLIPNAKMIDGAINVYPCLIDPLYDESHMGECTGRDCDQCRKKYWTEEIE